MMKRLTGLMVLGMVSALLLGCPQGNPYLQVSAREHHFGVVADAYETEWTFDVSNDGGAESTLLFTITVDEPWVSVSPESGTIVGNTTNMPITVSVDRDYASKKLNLPKATITVDSGFMQREVEVTTAPDYFTEQFDGNVDLAGRTLRFTPSDGLSFYSQDAVAVSDGFPTDPAGGLLLDFDALGDPIWAAPLAGMTVPFYGQDEDSFYIGSGGWLGFGDSAVAPLSLGAHFYTPKISALPVDGTADGSMVSLLQDAEKVVVTWENVPTVDNPAEMNDFQVEMFFNGDIHITYLNADAGIAGVVGLSAGNGDGLEPPADFLETDLNTVPLASSL